ncbi:tRNA G46 methylase TrmB [Marinospirillum celere]|uniref:tRNA (guanine(46)-N(7))-methyltransferase n=1 Tax=Marinospirillum celere TaxID=1122252 RepID=A0A1I1HWX1_9GAMM|nr:SAM-dependent methyltransferase [Marinospirillum celere]SFC28444.1 tRNA G46 methylase TrmB [Marinospirillum celere]
MAEQGNSRQVTSNQLGVHDQLLQVVEKHRQSLFKKPITTFNREAFEEAEAAWQAFGGRLILDSCCGVGASTRKLASRYPEHFVIGVDRSEDRLSRKLGELPANAVLIRADLVDFWRLAEAAGWKPEYHFLLYPNPTPKKKDLKQRWHGHPVFPSLVALGGQLESRSNWRIYLEEMQLALKVFGVEAEITALDMDEPITPFERKYHLSGQDLWQLKANLNELATG